MGQNAAGPTTLSSGERKYPLGYISSPLDLSHVTPPKDLFLRDRGDALTSAYDLRDHSALTNVRDQNPYGTCWAFGALASLESTFKKREGEGFDFSEWHLVYYAYVDEKPRFPAFTQRTSAIASIPITQAADATPFLSRPLSSGSLFPCSSFGGDNPKKPSCFRSMDLHEERRCRKSRKGNFPLPALLL